MIGLELPVSLVGVLGHLYSLSLSSRGTGRIRLIELQVLEAGDDVVHRLLLGLAEVLLLFALRGLHAAGLRGRGRRGGGRLAGALGRRRAGGGRRRARRGVELRRDALAEGDLLAAGAERHLPALDLEIIELGN